MGVRKFELSHGEKLKIIEKFSVLIAQAIVGGIPTQANHPCGDLLHPNGEYSEVKGAGESSGAIIRKHQLLRHLKGPTRDYILVFKKNRIWEKGRFRYLTCSKGKTRAQLERICLESISLIVIVPTPGVLTLYENMRKRSERTYHFKSGPKTYIKVRENNLSSLARDYMQCLSTRKIQVNSHTLDVKVITYEDILSVDNDVEYF